MADTFNNMSGDHTGEFDTQDITNNKVVSVLAYIPILFWLPLVVNSNSRFGKFHANQGLGLLLTGIVVSVALAVLHLLLGWIPILGTIIVGLVRIALSLILLVLAILGMVNTGNGNAKELPVIGGLFHFINY